MASNKPVPESFQQGESLTVEISVLENASTVDLSQAEEIRVIGRLAGAEVIKFALVPPDSTYETLQLNPTENYKIQLAFTSSKTAELANGALHLTVKTSTPNPDTNSSAILPTIEQEFVGGVVYIKAGQAKDELTKP